MSQPDVPQRKQTAIHERTILILQQQPHTLTRRRQDREYDRDTQG